MAFTANIVTVAEMQSMAGAGVGAMGSSDPDHTTLQDYAEAYLSTLVKYDISTNWGTMNAVYKILFTEWAARFAGVVMIADDTSGYANIVEAENLIQTHIFRMNIIERLLEKSDIQDFQGT